MRFRWPPRSLLAQSILWIVLPLALVMFGAAGGGIYAYQSSMALLLIDRDRQLATLSATRVSETIEGYARVLVTLAANPDVRSPSAELRASTLDNSADALQIFNAGVTIVDVDGHVLTTSLGATAAIGGQVGAQPYFQTIRAQLEPAYSNVLADAITGEDMVLVGVPILDESNVMTGALIGAVHLHNSPLGEPIQRLIVGNGGFAYLVDGNGRVIFHPDQVSIGADFSDRPYVQRVIAGESGGALATNPTGERVVVGYAPVQLTGWGLILREPWNTVIAPVKRYIVAVVIVGLAAIVIASILLLLGIRRITRPVELLAQQTRRLAAGQSIEPLAETGIPEVDQLERAFHRMSVDIAANRAGLQRYVGAITNARENEQRRLARDLHDDTTQGLLAITRQLELNQVAETDPARQARLAELRSMLADTLRGLRRLSRDLRPLALEDLGLVPALRALISGTRDTDPLLGQVGLRIAGPPAALNQEQELAVYRIVQEALSNVRKHARAAQVYVELVFEAGQTRLEIRDDGAGFEVPNALGELAQKGHFGLMGMQERVWAVGALFAIESAPGKGTRIRITIPRIRTEAPEPQESPQPERAIP